MEGDGADLGEPETEIRPDFGGETVLVEPGGEADGVGEVQAPEGLGQAGVRGAAGIAQLVPQQFRGPAVAVVVQPGQEGDRLLGHPLGVGIHIGHQQRTDQGFVEIHRAIAQRHNQIHCKLPPELPGGWMEAHP